jgi:tRNA U34 2-thiouridine synthase MnmA/TrmU
MATGHYARTAPFEGNSTEVSLIRGIDRTKDQTYFLSTTPVSQLTLSFPPTHRILQQLIRAPVGTLLPKSLIPCGTSPQKRSERNCRVLL